MNHLCVRSIERKISSKNKIYFQLKVSAVSTSRLSEELIDLYNFDTWVFVNKEEYKVNVFYNDEYKSIMEWPLINSIKMSPSSVDLGLVIGDINARFEQNNLIVHNDIGNLFDGCVKGIIKPGSLLYGIIARDYVVPYEFDGKMVCSYTKAIFWPKGLSDKEKPQYIKESFAESGRIVVGEKRSFIDGFFNSGDGGSYNEYGGHSDGYGGYLDDDFIDDVLDGDVDAHWNID